MVLDAILDSEHETLTRISTTKPKSVLWTMCWESKTDGHSVYAKSVHDHAYVVCDEFESLPDCYDEKEGFIATDCLIVDADTTRCSYVAIHFPSELNDELKKKIIQAVAAENLNAMHDLGYENNKEKSNMVFRGKLCIEKLTV